jgi:hypothetical protein
VAGSTQVFLRSHGRDKDGKHHNYFSLVETVRTPDGPRQRTLCYLGELHHREQTRWHKAVEVFTDDGQSRQLKLFPAEADLANDDPGIARVLVDKVRLERVRRFGDCFLGLELWKRLGLDDLFEDTLDRERADVAWSRVAAVLAVNRLCAPGSELAIEQRWYPTTALDDLLRIPDGKLNHTRLYRCLDRLLPCKAVLERHFKRKWGELFAAEFDVLLYDLTSTYVEGAARRNEQMQRGYSRDHRPDCKQVVIALIVNPDGLPLSYEVFAGDRADVTTMEEALETVEHKYGRARRVWVVDRGLLSEANLEAIREHQGYYLAGTPRAQLKQFEKQLLAGSWERVRDDVEVQLIASEDSDETFVLCRTQGRQEKEQAIRNRFEARLEQVLERLARSLARGRLKDRDKILLRLGRLQALYPQVANLYEWELVAADKGYELHWRRHDANSERRRLREGAYLLRTNLRNKDPAELWRTYVQLTEVEAAFRALKSELAIRPLYHQLERRVQAHILVAFLGYALWATLKQLLCRSGAELSPARALARLSSLYSGDIVLPTTAGREIRLRRVTEPTEEQNRLLTQLGLRLPKQLARNRECSADFAVA